MAQHEETPGRGFPGASELHSAEQAERYEDNRSLDQKQGEVKFAGPSKTKQAALTPERLRELLDYDPDTGLFRWRVATNSRVRVGQIAGHRRRDGYVRIRIDGCFHLAHRLAWMHVYGYHPSRDVDHANRITSDNRISNLRLATPSQNLGNSCKYYNNTSGFKGVFRACKKWRAEININAIRYNLGRFTSPEAAHAAYCEAAQRYFGEYWRAG